MIAEIVVFCSVLYLLYKWIMPVIPANFPPGPTNYPIIGGAHKLQQLDPVSGVAIMKLGEKYGPVTGLYLGNTLSIVVNGYEPIKEVLSREEFNGRPEMFYKFLESMEGFYQKKGIIMNNGEEWQEQRRFTLRVLRDLGFGKSNLEGVIHDEIKECLQVLQKKVKESSNEIGVSIHDAFTVSFINVLWHVVSGKRFKHDDEEFLKILETIKKGFRTPNPLSNIIINYPFLKHFPVFSTLYKNLTDGRIVMGEMFKKTIADCQNRKTYDVDFIHEYLKELENVDQSGKMTSFSLGQMVAICTDLFGAGAETTSNSIAFGLLYMVHYPEVQRKVHEELDRVVGKSQLPSLNDKPQLIYTEAVLNELFRVSSVAPITVPHATLVDTKFQGFDIPKNTMIQINLHSINMDKSYWGDPDIFRPERFIGSDGKIVKTERLIPFGLGRRICPGESLARMSLYLFFTAVMQAFKVEQVPGTPKPSLIPVPGFTIAPAPFNAVLSPRK